MAATTFGGPITPGAAVRVSLTSGLSSLGGAREFFSEGVLRADSTNTGVIWIGKSNVTTAANQMGFLRAGDALTININVFLSTDELYLAATVATDKVYLLALAR